MARAAMHGAAGTGATTKAEVFYIAEDDSPASTLAPEPPLYSPDASPSRFAIAEEDEEDACGPWDVEAARAELRRKLAEMTTVVRSKCSPASLEARGLQPGFALHCLGTEELRLAVRQACGPEVGGRREETGPLKTRAIEPDFALNHVEESELRLALRQACEGVEGDLPRVDAAKDWTPSWTRGAPVPPATTAGGARRPSLTAVLGLRAPSPPPPWGSEAAPPATADPRPGAGAVAAAVVAWPRLADSSWWSRRQEERPEEGAQREPAESDLPPDLRDARAKVRGLREVLRLKDAELRLVLRQNAAGNSELVDRTMMAPPKQEEAASVGEARVQLVELRRALQLKEAELRIAVCQSPPAQKEAPAARAAGAREMDPGFVMRLQDPEVQLAVRQTCAGAARLGGSGPGPHLGGAGCAVDEMD